MRSEILQPGPHKLRGRNINKTAGNVLFPGEEAAEAKVPGSLSQGA